MSDDSATDDAGGADYRQVSFVALAALALVLAAAFAPGMAGQNGAGSGSDGGSGGRIEPGDGESGDGPSVEFDWRWLRKWLDSDSGDGNARETSDPACIITLDRNPVPGDRVTATIRYEGEPLADTPVWFNERRVGATDERGRVTGEVPYVEKLKIRAGAGSDVTCRAQTATSPTVIAGAVDRRPTDGRRQSRAMAAMPASNADPRETAVAVPLASASSPAATPTADSTPPAASRPPLETPRVQAGATGNATGEYTVEGEVEIDVRGEPYPGETITVEAAIRGVPMREATVSVDGTTVGETDADGTAAVTVPDDGTDEFELEVARGDFAGTTTVDVLLLEATLTPDGLAPIPGSDGAVNATIDGKPVEGAAVTVGGERVGTTGADGRLAVGIPRDPTTTVTVSTDRQTASVSLLGQYGPTAFLIALVVAGVAALSARRYGRRGPIVVVGIAATLFAVLVVEAFYGPRAGLAALALVAVLGLAAGPLRSDAERPRVRNPPSIRAWLGRLEARLVAAALGAVGRVEVLLEWGWFRIETLRAWLRTLPRSATGLGRRLAAWLGRLPGRTRARLRDLLRTVRTVSVRTVAVGVAAVSLIAGGYAVDGVRGGVVVAVVLAAAGLLARRSDEADAETTAAADAVDPTSAETTATEPTDEPRSFRELWRAFARRIAPRRWRTRTPGEIERRALAEDYPREPVRELTALFREVEYGDRVRSRDHRDRAADAYDAIERARTRDADRERSAENGSASTGSDAETDARTEDQP